MQRLSLLLAGLMLFMLTINESFAAPPTVQSSGISFSQIKDTEFRILIGTSGNGEKRVIVVQPGNAVNETPSINYDGSANANFGSAPVITTNARVVYSGTGKNVIVTGLTPGTQYTIRVFEKNGTDEYLTSTNATNPRSNYTLPGVPATVSTSNVTHTSFRVNWTDPASGGFEGFHVTVSDDASFSYGLNWYDAVDVGNAHKLDVSDVPPTDILPNTTYYYRVRAYQQSRYGNWKTGALGVTTLPENPTISASSATICLGNTYVLTPTGPNPGSGTNQHKFKVYDQASGGTALYNYALLSINLTPQSAGVVNYWVATVSNKTGLESASRTQFTLTVNGAGPIADAGNDVVLCENAPYTYTFTGNNPAPAYGEWTQVSGPTSINLSGVDYNGEVGLTQYGTYVFRWTISNDGCTTTYDDVTVTLTQPPSNASITTAGNNDFGGAITICGTLTATVEAEAPTAGIGTWTALCFDAETESLIPCNPGLIFSPNANSPTVSVTAPAYGKYYLYWTVSNGTCDSNEDGITLVFDQTPTVANAGNDDGSCGLTSINLNANAPTSGTGEWTQISGPGTAEFDDDELHNTSVSVDEYGVYTFRWTIASTFDVCSPTSDDVVITFSEPISNAVAGVAHTLVCGDKSVFLAATPITVGNGKWTVISHPTGSTYSFDNPTYPDAFFEADEFGSYTLRWTVTDPYGICPPKTSDITFAFSDNTTPANAGFDKDVCGLTATLDGNSPTVGVGTWSLDVGPGAANFTSANTYNSNVSVSDWGTYSFEWKISSSCGTSEDYVHITFWNDLSGWTAGNDFSSCGTNSTITLAGSNPTTFGAGASGEWTKVSGPGLVSYVNSTTKNDYNAQIQVNMIGTYVMRWTGYNGPCTNYKEVQFTVVTPPIVTFNPVGGPYCTTDNSVIALSASPSGGTFTGPGVSGGNFIPSLAGTAGTHTLTYTYTNAPCTITAYQTVVLTTPVAITWTDTYGPYCVDDGSSTLSGATPAGGTYSGPGVSGTNFNPTTAGPGTHTLTYTYTSGGCVSTATNTIVVNPKPIVTFSTIPNQCTTADLVDLTTYVNQIGGTFTGTGVTGTNFDPNVGAGTFTLTYTYMDANTCTNSATTTVTVVAPPSVTFNAVGGPYCATSSTPITLTATPIGGTFSGPGVSGNTFTPSAVLGGAGTYTLTYTYTSSPCTVIETQTVVLTAPPIITWTNTYGPVCTDGTPITLGGALPSGGTYSGTGVTDGIHFEPSIAGSGTHTITYTYSDGGCVSTATKTILVNALPTVTFGTIPNQCLTSSLVDLTTYVNQIGGTFTGTGVTSTNFDPNVGAGTYTLTYTYTDVNGCTNSATTIVTVVAPPSVTFNAVGGPYCATFDSEITLSATPIGGTFSGAGVSGTTFNPSRVGTAGTYTLTYTYTSSPCTVVATQTVVLTAPPIITWTNTYGPVCTNANPITLGGALPSGGTYSGTGVTDGIHFEPSIAGSGTHTITYTYSDGGCVSTATKTIVVDKLPTITWTQTFNPICINANVVTLTATTDVGTGVYSGTGVTGTTFYPSSAGVGTHTITYTATNGACSVFETKTIVVDKLPTITWTQTFSSMCINANPLSLSASTDVGSGVFSGNGVTNDTFYPSVAGVGTHTITYTATNGACSVFETKTIVVDKLPTITWTASYGPYCQNSASVTLTATTDVGTGVYSGTGVTGTTFYPSSAGVGTHTITYTATNGACSVFETKTIVVDKLPTITWTQTFSSMCINANPLSLSASTDVGSGVFSGNGVTNDTFYPSVAGVGTHTITYTATNGACSVFATKTIVVDKLPTITWTQTFNPICINANVVSLSASTDVGSGSYSGTGVTGSTFNPSVAGVGTHTITYTATNGACSVFATKTIVVDKLPTITWTQTFNPMCINANPLSLSASTDVGSGVFSGNGVTNNTFNPSVAGVGTYTITYTATNGACSVIATKTITVNGLPTVSAGTYSAVCVNSTSFTLTNGSPANGTYSGNGVTSNVFYPTSAGVGVHTLTYTYTDGNGCTNSATTTITVNALVAANAGNDASVTPDEKTYQLGATNPSPATGLWTKVSGPGTATFASASTFNTNVTVSAFGTYTFRWTVTNGACVSYDDVVITFVEGSAVATKLHIVNPGTQISGTAFNLTVQTLDQYNNPVAPTGTVNFTITVKEGDATFSTTVTGSITAPAYSTTLSVTLNAGNPLVGAADVNLEATDNANNLASGSSAYFNLVATVPTIQASNLSFINWTTNSVDLAWASNGNGDGVIVMGSRGRLSIPATYKFTNGASYTANAAFGSGTTIAANTYAVYQGTGSSVAVTGLSSKTQYAFKVCAYQGAGNLRSFNNTNAALNSNNRGGMTLKGAFDAEDLPLVGDNVLSASHISPNPARDYVMMTVDLTQSANLKIAFFSADGKQVLLPVNGATYNAGRHSFNVPLKGLAAGVYSVVITADNEVIIDNVVVMP